MSAIQPTIRPFQTWKKDLGVAIVVVVALALAYVMSQVVINRTKTFQAADGPFSIQYPGSWTNSESLQQVLLKVENPATDSAYKTSLTVEARDLDPSAPPVMQTLIDRRVEQRSGLTAYHFISNTQKTIAGVPAEELIYTYVVQPNDTPRRASLPVVVIARDDILLTQTTVYYITMVAPQTEFDQASQRMDTILKSVKVQ